jgi:hypothetical protein
MTVLVILEGVVILLLGLLVAGLLRSHAEILRKLHELGASIEQHPPSQPDLDFSPNVVSPRSDQTPGHDIAGTTPSGEAVGIAVTGARHRTLVAFLSSGCLTCAAFWEAFAADRLPGLEETRLVVVTKDRSEESPSKVGALAPHAHPVVMSAGAWSDYLVPGSPYFVLVDGPSNRVIGEGSASSWDQLSNLMQQALADVKTPSGGRSRRARATAARDARDEAALSAAGIGPGHSSLYENPEQAEEQDP